jgi:hypothetical protein
MILNPDDTAPGDLIVKFLKAPFREGTQKHLGDSKSS